MRDIKMIILHCSASDNPEHDNVEVIRDWHMNGNGWSDIGYHFFIRSTGLLEMGRGVALKGAHTFNFNGDSIGICLSGNTKFGEKQIDSCVDFVKLLCVVFNLDKSAVYGHYEFTDKKTCPNIDMDWFREKLN